MDRGDTFGLNGKRALVTGGSRGVGAATARLLARHGADVGVTYHTRGNDAEAVVAECREHGVRAWAEGINAASADDIGRVVHRCEEVFGGLDIVVANAGIWSAAHVSAAEMEPAQWHRTLETNLTSIFHTVRAAAPLLSDDGRFVLVSSTAGQRGEPGHADYAASKGGMISFCKSVAVELAPRGITVNCVAPGWIETEMSAGALQGEGRARAEAEIPLGRIASAEDVAGPILFLCSELARHVTAEILNVNGGSVRIG